MGATTYESTFAEQSPALQHHPRFLGNLARAIKSTVEHVLLKEGHYLSAVENGEGISPKEIGEVRQKYQNKVLVGQCLTSIADDLGVGKIPPSGTSIACLQAAESEGTGCLVLILPADEVSLLAGSRAPEVEGSRLLFFGEESEEAKRLLAAQTGERLTAPWDETEYVIREMITSPVLAST